jgi:hypothetical protein
MDNKKLAIATITWARDAHEEQVLRTSLESLATLQLPVFITDGGSGPSFIAFLNSNPHFKVVPTAGKGVWAQAKSSLQAAFASQAGNICYTEPDKGDFFLRALPQFLETGSKQNQAGVVLACRSETAFATFPTFQQATENAINRCCAELIGPEVDYTYGPFLLRRELVPYLDLIQEDIGWGWRPFTFGLAHRLGLPVTSWEGDFACPSDQCEDDPGERLYRIRQLHQNIQGLLLSTTFNSDQLAVKSNQ